MERLRLAYAGAVIRSICLFCGARGGNDPAYRAAATNFGGLVARRGLELVYGAGRTGLMGAAVQAALSAGAQATGVVPEALNTPAQVHSPLTRLVVVRDLAARKREMLELADAFVALPGGYGTLDEVLEATGQAQLGLHNKPVGLLNTRGYFDGLIHQLDRGVRDGFITDAERRLVVVTDDAARLLDKLTARLAPQNGSPDLG